MIARKIARVTAVLVAISTGIYFFVYLYRWEWNRALIAAALFVAVEILLVADSMLRRMKRLEDKIDARYAGVGEVIAPQGQPLSDPLVHLEQSAPAPRDHFAWLSGEGELKVFVPVLMGAGFVVSALAWGVERLSRATAKPALEKRLAARLSSISLPVGALVGPSSVTLPPAPARQRSIPIRALLITITAGFLLVQSLDLLADLTQGRPDAPTTGTVSEVVMELSHKSTDRSALVTAASLLGACELSVPKHVDFRDLRATGKYSVAFTISPGLGPQEEKRMRGCLQDVTLDNVQGTVSTFTTRPAGG